MCVDSIIDKIIFVPREYKRGTECSTHTGHKAAKDTVQKASVHGREKRSGTKVQITATLK